MTFSLHQGGVVMSSQVKHKHSHQDCVCPYTFNSIQFFIAVTITHTTEMHNTHNRGRKKSLQALIEANSLLFRQNI